MTKIREACMELILGASRELYPREFIGLLRGDKDLISEVLVIPRSLYGEGFAQIRWNHVPIDNTIIGSVHSHPSENNRPSKTDINYFKKTGDIHLIIKQPARGIEDIACYNRDGNYLPIARL